jgi:hypothetical protein
MDAFDTADESAAQLHRSRRAFLGREYVLQSYGNASSF